MDDYYDPSGYGALFAFLAISGLIFFFIFVIVYVIGAFFLMRLFDKAGVQGKWRAWVPVYNMMVLGKLGDVSPWGVLGASVLSSSDDRRVGKGCVSTGRSRWASDH